MSLGELLKVRALERREELVKALIDAAVQGREVPALRVIFDRLEGRVAERIEVDDVRIPQTVADIDAMTPEQRRAALREMTRRLDRTGTSD
jgi:hypothetical protein